MLVIALTGGIGAGKSTVAKLFSELGADCIDMDRIARELVDPASPLFDQDAYDAIVRYFGTEVQLLDRTLDRKKIGERVFSNSADRHQLESILHPRISQQVQEQLAESGADVCIVEIPLLTSRDQFKFIDRILVIDVDEQIQIRRTKKRDELNNSQINAIMSAQINRTNRLALADDVIVNNGTLAELESQVSELYQQYTTGDTQ